MTVAVKPSGPDSIDRGALVDFYAEYYDALDAVDLERWPDLFTEDCFYRIMARENYERGLRLGTIMAESRGMLFDRVNALRKTQVFAPRYYRRFPGPIRITEQDGSGVSAEHNLLIVQTLIDKGSEILMSARCYDKITIEDERMLIKRREVVFDSEMIPNSLIYPA